MQEALEVAVAAARKAGMVLKKGMNAEKHAQAKSHVYDPVTVFDRRSEKIISDQIKGAFPSHGIVSEEGTRINEESSLVWVIDPLDGTNNFLRGIPHFCVSLALMDEGKSQLACTYDPLRDELFTAIVGRGATMNEKPLHVSEQPTLRGAVVGVGFSSRSHLALQTQSSLPEIIAQVRGLRTYGSACLDLAYVASGRMDALWYLSLWPWDIAAGSLLLTEAGGMVSDLLGYEITDSQKGIVATNQLVHAEMLSVINK